MLDYATAATPVHPGRRHPVVSFLWGLDVALLCVAAGLWAASAGRVIDVLVMDDSRGYLRSVRFVDGELDVETAHGSLGYLRLWFLCLALAAWPAIRLKGYVRRRRLSSRRDVTPEQAD